MDGWYLAALVVLLIWVRRKEDGRELLVTAALPLVGLLAGVWADRLDVPVFGELAQTTNIYRLVTLLLPLAAWAPIVALVDWRRHQGRGVMAILSGVLLMSWYGMFSAAADGNVVAGMPAVLSAATVGIVLLAAWTQQTPTWVPKAVALAVAVVLVGGWGPLAVRAFHIGLDPSDPRAVAGRAIESAAPPGSVIAAPPVLKWVRSASRRAVVTDCKAVPYGGRPWDEHKQRMAALGGWDCTGTDGFAGLTLQDVEDLRARYGATHMLVPESDPKFLDAAAARWTLVDEFPGWVSRGETHGENDVPAVPMRLFEIP